MTGYFRALLLISLTFLCLLLVGIAPLAAQDSSAYYTVMHPAEFAINWKSFYDKMDAMTAEMRKQLPHHLDLPFGQHPKQRLDLYLPQGSVRNAPVFLFFHGGGFREGDRANYGAVARGFSRHGIITAVAGYRLTSQEYHFPDQAEDGQRAVAWLYRNIERYGGDPNRIFVGGHSAGAYLTAELVVKTLWLDVLGLPRDVIKGAIPISGRYGVRLEDKMYVRDQALWPIASPLANISNAGTPFLVAVGSTETAYVAASRQFIDALIARGGQADILILDGQAHDQTALSLCDPDSEMFQAALKMILSNEQP